MGAVKTTCCCVTLQMEGFLRPTWFFFTNIKTMPGLGWRRLVFSPYPSVILFVMHVSYPGPLIFVVLIFLDFKALI